MSDFHKGEFGRTESALARIDYDRMLRDKLQRARQKMKEHDLQVMICFTDPNIAYTTNYTPVGAQAVAGGVRYVILPFDSDPILFEECDPAYHLRNKLPGLRVEFSIPPTGGPFNVSAPDAQKFLLKSWGEQIHSFLKELRLHKETIGLDTNIPQVVRQLEEMGLKVSLDGGKALLEARSVKTPEEEECVRAVAAIIDGCFSTMAQILRPGITEREVFAKCVGYGLMRGATVDGGQFWSGPETWPKDNSVQVTDRIIRPGDVVYADYYGFGFAGYKSCYYRTFYVGHAPREVKETHRRVYSWLSEAEKAVKPGATTKDVMENWPDEKELWSDKPPYIKTEQDKLSTFLNNMGHGIGLSLYEQPFFWRPTSLRWPQKLEEGMTIALESQDAIPENRSGIRIEDMIVVTKTGHEVISRWPTEEITEVPYY